MGKRSGVPHTDDELDERTGEELKAELDRSRLRLTIAPSEKMAKQWRKRVNWLEAAVEWGGANVRFPLTTGHSARRFAECPLTPHNRSFGMPKGVLESGQAAYAQTWT